MRSIGYSDSSDRYARCIKASKRVRWDIDDGRHPGAPLRRRRRSSCPTAFRWRDGFTTLSADEKRFVSQIQGRTYANVFGLVERFITAKVLELSREHWFGDQIALEALVRFSDEELKHQALFRRIDAMIGRDHAGGLSLRRRSRTRSPAPCSARAPGRCWR